MKQSVFNLMLLWGLVISANLSAQNCGPGPYRFPHFGGSVIDTNVVYGTVLNYGQVPVDLKMDIFRPLGDTSTRRPLIVWIHGGGFTSGSKTDLWQMCDSFTRRGYVTASISYRLGFYRQFDPILGEFQYPYTHDEAEFSRAVYRAMQDAKGAIRYLRGHASQYGIDTTCVYVAGESAGGFTALHTAFRDKTNEKPASADSIAPVKRFDLFGNLLFSALRPNLGSVEGELNQNGTSAKVSGIINIYGAIEDTLLIESANDPALFQYHILEDPIVHCGTAKAYYQTPGLIFPFGSAKVPLVHGACRIRERAISVGYTDERHKTYFRTPNLFANPPITPHNFSGEKAFLTDTLAAFLDKLYCLKNPATSLEKWEEEMQITLFPNPAQDLVTFRIPEIADRTTFAYIHDMSGRLWFSGEIINGSQINIESLPGGIYLVKVVAGSKFSIQKLQVLQH
ncbi:MAG: alpha/beta hydrolase fold domain-containing protein [Bacteroidia bacterium]|nr:alpha/beta hydrolase fold domain-containing protein [Bacteroidia bacterium]